MRRLRRAGGSIFTSRRCFRARVFRGRMGLRVGWWRGEESVSSSLVGGVWIGGVGEEEEEEEEEEEGESVSQSSSSEMASVRRAWEEVIWEEIRWVRLVELRQVRMSHWAQRTPVEERVDCLFGDWRGSFWGMQARRVRSSAHSRARVVRMCFWRKAVYFSGWHSSRPVIKAGRQLEERVVRMWVMALGV